MTFSGRIAAAVLAVGALAVAGAGVAHADDTVPFAQVVKKVDEKPVSGTFDWGYKNYGEWLSGAAAGYYRVDKGTLNVRLRSYVVSEGMNNYDEYLVTVEVDNPSSEGLSKIGWSKLAISTSVSGGAAGVRQLVDTDDSNSVTKDPDDCQSFPVTIGAGWGLAVQASAGVQVGTVRFCDDGASWVQSHPGGSGWNTTEGDDGRGVWEGTQMRKITHLVSSRLVKVANNALPTFKVSLVVPTDSCTHLAPGGECNGYTNDTTTYTKTIGVTG